VIRGINGTRGQFDYGDEDTEFSIREVIREEFSSLPVAENRKLVIFCDVCEHRIHIGEMYYDGGIGKRRAHQSCVYHAPFAKPLEEHASNERAAKLRGVTCFHCALEIYRSPNPKFPDIWIHRDTQETRCRDVHAYPTTKVRP
jgi:hypothetical protein